MDTIGAKALVAFREHKGNWTKEELVEAINALVVEERNICFAYKIYLDELAKVTNNNTFSELADSYWARKDQLTEFYSEEN